MGGLLGLVIANGWLDVNLLAMDVSFLTKLLTVVGSTAIGIWILGPYMRVIFNSPELHIWHHAHDMPESHRYGINFALTLAVWDYLFGTAYLPYEGRDIKLGFPGVETYPHSFLEQNAKGILK